MSYPVMEMSKPTSPGRLNSLHDLVLDYVSHHAYASTAKVLSKPRRRPLSLSVDTGTGHKLEATEGSGADEDVTMEHNGDHSAYAGGMTNGQTQKDKVRERLFTQAELESIERRRAVLNYILNGAILRAVDMLETHFPAVLDESIAVPTRSNDATSSSQPSQLLTGHAPFHSNHSTPVLSSSTVPAHVKLNLQIQSFIESFRNLAPSSPSSPASSISSLTSSMHVSTHNLAGHTTNGAGSMTISPGVTLTNALTAAQGLHAEAKKLPPDVRAVYLQEIKDVGALFAYTDPESSILSGFLAQDRRVALAEQVNLAILAAEERSGPAFLHSIAQRTGAIYGILANKGVDPRPANADEKERDHLYRYWKNQTGERYRFDLHEFTELAWH